MTAEDRPRLDAVCLGEAMALVSPDPPAGLSQARSFVLTHGGAESNVAVSLARLGSRVQWCSRLGDDVLGRRVQAEIEAAGVDTSLVATDPDRRTGVYFKDPGRDATRVLYYRDGSAASCMGGVEAQLVPRLIARGDDLDDERRSRVVHAVRTLAVKPAVGAPVVVGFTEVEDVDHRRQPCRQAYAGARWLRHTFGPTASPSVPASLPDTTSRTSRCARTYVSDH
jgi:hypothetical protein